MEIVEKTDAQWREELTPEQYQVLRKAGTERAFTGKYWDNHEDGIYRCAGCGAELFGSDTKFESGSGWPSFTEPKVADAVELKRDVTHGMIRTEVVCKRCGGHLGHVFDDGPRDRGRPALLHELLRDGLSAHRVGVALQQTGPTALRADGAPERLGLGVTVQVPVLEGDARRVALGREGHVDLADRGGIGLDHPGAADPPFEREPPGGS